MSRGIAGCAYCNAPNAGTMDHVPPENLFPSPKPNDLISVPCCEECRQGWSKDDEYFRLAVVSCASLFPTPARDSVNETVLRSLGRPEAKGFSRFINESLMRVQLTNDDGAVVGDARAIGVVKPRFDRVVGRIVRGLFYKELGRNLPVGYRTEIHFNQSGFPDALPLLLPKLHLFTPPRVVGDGVFAYRYGKAVEDENSIIWLLMFYEAVPLIVFTRREAL